MKYPKQKGNAHERAVAKLLSEWSGYEFHRTPQSGALHWSNDKRVISDIVPPQEILEKWPFSIECKNVETNFEISAFIDGTSQTLKEHWKQCWDDSQREDLLPMLVFTKKYRDIYMMTTFDVFKKLEIKPSCYLQVINQDLSLVIMKFKEFLNLISCEKLLNLKLK